MLTTTLLAQALDKSLDDLPLDGWQAISEASGISIAITGMAIVFVALTLISLFIAALPRILSVLEPWLPNLDSHVVQPPTDAERLPSEQERIVAAIGFVLHSESSRVASR